MNITCAICKEIFTPPDDIYSTQCGHVFHILCIEHWFQQGKKSCPTCREKANTDKLSSHRIHRMYFDISRSADVPQNVELIQQELDNLKCKVKTIEKENKNYKQDWEEADRKNKGLISEVRQLENRLEKNKEVIYSYKERLSELKNKEEENESLRKEISGLNNTLSHMQNIKDMLSGPFKKVESMFENINDVKQIKVYSSVLKKSYDEQTESFKKCKRQNAILKQQVADLTRQRNQLQDHCKKLTQVQENLAISESSKLEEANKSTIELSDSSLILESVTEPTKAPKHKIETSKNLVENADNCVPSKVRKCIFSEVVSDADTQAKNPDKTKKNNAENSPYLQAKGGVSSFRINFTKRSNSSSSLEDGRFSKKPRLALNNKKYMGAYDGFGGRTRDIEFSPTRVLSKTKKPIDHSVISKKAKLSEVKKNYKIDSFIDLTKNKVP